MQLPVCRKCSMHSVLVLVLISVLQLSINIPTVAGDCFTDGENCDTCYQTLAISLINSGDNKYILSQAFFPTDSALPIQVDVVYTDGENMTEEYYWLKEGFYVIQPVELFFYRSLFFSRPQWRKESITLQLPRICFEAVESDLLERLTQRVRSSMRVCKPNLCSTVLTVSLLRSAILFIPHEYSTACSVVYVHFSCTSNDGSNLTS